MGIAEVHSLLTTPRARSAVRRWNALLSGRWRKGKEVIVRRVATGTQAGAYSVNPVEYVWPLKQRIRGTAGNESDPGRRFIFR
ncbi:MAG: hypothetical protein OEV30_06740 [Ignavibacteria bacterium]|nr:hypothetical protein [Ignavibacteria bacterium]